MIIIIPTIKYGSIYYNTFTMGVCSNYHGYFFQCRSGNFRDFKTENIRKFSIGDFRKFKVV